MNRFLLIGGVPSSGSTLLMQRLSAHKNVLAMPETGIFAHGGNLHAQASKNAKSQLQIGIPWLDVSTKTAGTLGWNNLNLKETLANFPDAFEFMSTCIAPGTSKYLVEKTPENIFAFKTLLEIPGEHRVVVTNRDCLSIVQSMMRRGFGVLEALLIWFSHSIETMLLIRDYPDRVFLCRYDSLTSSPDKTVAAVQKFWKLGSKFKEKRKPVDTLDSRLLSNEVVVASSITDFKVDADFLVDEKELALLFQLSSWTLSGSSWRHAPWENVVGISPENLIGLEYDVMVEKLVFSVPGEGYFKIGPLEQMLQGTHDTLQPEKLSEDSLIPVSAEFDSLMLRTLAENYPMYIERG